MLIKIAKVDYIIDEGFMDRLQYLQGLGLLMEENFSDLVIIKVKEDLNPKRSSSPNIMRLKSTLLVKNSEINCNSKESQQESELVMEKFYEVFNYLVC